MQIHSSECIFAYWSLSLVWLKHMPFNVIACAAAHDPTALFSHQFITSCQLHQHTCWVDRCCVQPPCAAMTDPHNAHSTGVVSHKLPEVLLRNIERPCHAHVNTDYTHVKTGSILYNTQLMSSSWHAALRGSPAIVSHPLPQWGTVGLLFKFFLEAALGHLTDVLIISHVPSWTSFCSLIWFIASGESDTCTHILAHPFMVSQSNPTNWGTSNERVGVHTSAILLLALK